MTKFQFINERGEVVDSDSDVVPDGCGVRVPVMLMDSVQREVAAHVSRQALITDAFGAPAGRRPGYCYAPPTQAATARDAAFEESCNRIENAWRNPPVVFDAARPPVSEPTTPEAAFAAHEAWLRDAWRKAP